MGERAAVKRATGAFQTMRWWMEFVSVSRFASGYATVIIVDFDPIECAMVQKKFTLRSWRPFDLTQDRLSGRNVFDDGLRGRKRMLEERQTRCLT